MSGEHLETLFLLGSGIALITGAVFIFLPILIELLERFGYFIYEDIDREDYHVHKWEYRKYRMELKEKHISFDLPVRECNKCGQKQYRGMMPKVRNKWKNFTGKIDLKCGDETLKTIEP